MTVIAYRDGVLAADTAGWQDDIITCSVSKITKLPDGTLFASCGLLCDGAEHVRWLEKGERRDQIPPRIEDESFVGFHVMPNGDLYMVGRDHERNKIDAEYAAIGSHTEFLYGAMAAGASAEKAVELAIKICAFAGGKVETARVEW